jgi:hypothetical protein
MHVWAVWLENCSYRSLLSTYLNFAIKEYWKNLIKLDIHRPLIDQGWSCTLGDTTNHCETCIKNTLDDKDDMSSKLCEYKDKLTPGGRAGSSDAEVS